MQSHLNPIVVIGETLVDFICTDAVDNLGDLNALSFKALPGGAPANVATGLAKLGCPVYLISGFADEPVFSQWLQSIVASAGVNLKFAQTVPNTNTRIAYVFTLENGEREFRHFTAEPCADTAIQISEDVFKSIQSAPIVYGFGSFLPSEINGKETILNLLDRLGQDSKAIKVYDPNIRMTIWKSDAAARLSLESILPKVDIAKLSDNEIVLLQKSGESIEATMQRLLTQYQLSLLLVTFGSAGTKFAFDSACGHVPALAVKVVETTGAGDGFTAGFLSGLYDWLSQNQGQSTESPINILKTIKKEALYQIIERANAVGAMTTTKIGAMAALPSKTELEVFLADKSNRLAHVSS